MPKAISISDVDARQRDVLQRAVVVSPNRVEHDIADCRKTCNIRVVLEVFAVKRYAVLPETLYDAANLPHTHTFEF